VDAASHARDLHKFSQSMNFNKVFVSGHNVVEARTSLRSLENIHLCKVSVRNIFQKRVLSSCKYVTNSVSWS
jgi:hypothetical protein